LLIVNAQKHNQPNSFCISGHFYIKRYQNKKKTKQNKTRLIRETDRDRDKYTGRQRERDSERERERENKKNVLKGLRDSRLIMV